MVSSALSQGVAMLKRLSAEFIGTLWLVLGGCGSAVIAAAFPNVGIGLLGVSFAFGLTVLTMAYAVGHISGCHLNPAVSVGCLHAEDFQPKIYYHTLARKCLVGLLVQRCFT